MMNGHFDTSSLIFLFLCYFARLQVTHKEVRSEAEREGDGVEGTGMGAGVRGKGRRGQTLQEGKER